MRITMNFSGLDRVQKQLAKLTGPQAAAAYAKAINDTAGKVQREMRAEIDSVFDRPTRYIRNSIWVTRATPDNLIANVAPTYARQDLSYKPLWKGGKIGVDPQDILAAQEAGGTRRDKKSESALRRARILPPGYQTSIPAKPYPGSDDGLGNFRGAFLQQLISYFQAFGEQGYKANMTEKTKKKLINKQQIGSIGRRRVYQTTLGVRYFISYANLRRNPKSKHFAPGIWAASGTHGVDVRPVLMFVKTGNYRRRFTMERVAQKADATNYLATRLRYRIRQAAGE
jgi:hypothetical protein